MTPQTPSRAALQRIALARLFAGLVVIGCLLFVPAGTLRFWQAWLWLALVLGSIGIIGLALSFLDPQLLERRMRLGEREAPQKKVVGSFTLILVTAFLVPGLDRRFGWSSVPPAVVLVADALILLGLLLFVLTIRENRYASRVIEVEERQAVISTGPYSLVRHPMYLSMLMVLGFTCLALGSYWAAIPSLAMPILFAARIRNEEQMLRKDLPGYDEYTRKVRYRLVPFVW
jgi:protein-S-isoprenylcysteine O-methyltransferase Ste14